MGIEPEYSQYEKIYGISPEEARWLMSAGKLPFLMIPLVGYAGNYPISIGMVGVRLPEIGFEIAMIIGLPVLSDVDDICAIASAIKAICSGDTDWKQKSLNAGLLAAAIVSLAPGPDIPHQKVFGVHWTSADTEIKIDKSGKINPSYNDLIWFQTATSSGQLKQILKKGAAGTGAKSNEVAIIVDLSGQTFKHGSLTNPKGGGVSILAPKGFNISGKGGKGITWYRNTKVQNHVNDIVKFVMDGRRNY